MTIRAVKWSRELSVGNDTLDDDHRRLMALMNKVIAAFYTGVGKSVVGPALDELEAYTREHFQREIAMLEERNAPDLDEHRRQHAALEEELRRLRQDKPGAEIAALLYSWLVDHILTTDMGYRSLFE